MPDARSAESSTWRKLYSDPRWCGPHGIRQQALVRDLYTCQRCHTMLVTHDRHHPDAAVVNHKTPHKGDPALFFSLENTESVCKTCHDGAIQSEEARGYSTAIGLDGWPTDPRHPANTGKMPERVGNAMTHPAWFRPVHVPLTIVCGAPGSGKSTYVRNHASAHDLLICFDTIASALFSAKGERVHASLGGEGIRDVLRRRNDMLGDLMRAAARSKWPAAWLIVSEPKAERRQWWADRVRPARIVVMETPAEVCMGRVDADSAAGDHRHQAHASIASWWAAYKPRDGDVTIKPEWGGGRKGQTDPNPYRRPKTSVLQTQEFL